MKWGRKEEEFTPEAIDQLIREYVSFDDSSCYEARFIAEQIFEATGYIIGSKLVPVSFDEEEKPRSFPVRELNDTIPSPNSKTKEKKNRAEKNKIDYRELSAGIGQSESDTLLNVFLVFFDNLSV